MRHRKTMLMVLSLVAAVALAQCIKGDDKPPDGHHGSDPALVRKGKEIFRFDTFGDEEFWSGALHIDKAIAGEDNGGFGDGVSPNTALAVGLKVDADALPAAVKAGIKSGDIKLDDPATTLVLLQLDAVVGLKAKFNNEGVLKSVGLTCASCHSTVDNSFAEGIGKRLDGWPNRDLNVGAIISLTDNAKPITDVLNVDEATLRMVLGMWGPGKYSPQLFLDGKAFRPDGKIAANLLPAAFGLKDIKLTTYTGFGDISYWNAFVGTVQMHGKGSFRDDRLNDPVKYPVAVANGFWNVTSTPDLLSSKLPALKAYQHSISAPKPPPGSFNQQAATRGKKVFFGKAECADCHKAPLYADNILHDATEIGIDDFEAKRSPTGKYRTMPLSGLFTKTKGGFYHDGRFATLKDVVNHYDSHLKTGLSTQEKDDLVEYLKSL